MKWNNAWILSGRRSSQSTSLFFVTFHRYHRLKRTACFSRLAFSGSLQIIMMSPNVWREFRRVSLIPRLSWARSGGRLIQTPQGWRLYKAVRVVGDTKVGLHPEQHLLEWSEPAAVIFTVLPTKADYPAGHIVSCKFCFAELFDLTCFHSQLIKKKQWMDGYHIRWPINQVFRLKFCLVIRNSSVSIRILFALNYHNALWHFARVQPSCAEWKV